MRAYCTKVDVQQITISHLRLDSYSVINGNAFAIYRAANVSLRDITIEDSTTPLSLLKISLCCMIELKGHILFRNNKNSSYIADFSVIERSMKFFSPSKMEFYGNSGIYGSLLRIHTNYKPIASVNGIKCYIYIEGHQYNKTSLQFKSNELLDDSSLMFIETGMDDYHFPRFFAKNTEFIFENNTIITLLHKNYKLPKYRIAAVLLFFQTAVLFANTNMLFVNNSVSEGGILMIVNSALHVNNDFYAKFENNQGYDGGAMTSYKRSHITLGSKSSKAYAHFVFKNNLAHNRGGAIFVEDLDYIESFGRVDAIYFVDDNVLADASFKVKFELFNNTAKTSGNEVYGGWIDRFSDAEFNITVNNRYAVSSNPVRICMCSNQSFPQCKMEKEFNIFPGQMFQIEAAAVGQRYGIASSIVTAELLDSDGHLDQGQEVQSVGRECTVLYYTVYSNRKFENIKSTVGDQSIRPRFKDTLANFIPPEYYDNLSKELVINIELKQCLLGFVFDAGRRACVCSPKISAHTGVFCDFDSYQITKTKQLWLSAPNHHMVEDNGVIIHDFCPYDYCKQLDDNERLSFLLESPDDQCAFNRSGVMCGACQQNLSQVFGTSKCRKCSNS